LSSDYTKHLKETATEILLLKNLTDSYLWSELFEHSKAFAWVLVCIVMRVIVLATAPLSVPMLAFGQMKIEQKRKSAPLFRLENIKNNYGSKS
jgi:hypothetical protein